MNEQMWKGIDHLEEVPQKSGFVRFCEMLFSNFWNFFRANLILLAGALPGTVLVIWGIWGRSLRLALCCADCMAPSSGHCGGNPVSGRCSISVNSSGTGRRPCFPVAPRG